MEQNQNQKDVCSFFHWTQRLFLPNWVRFPGIPTETAALVFIWQLSLMPSLVHLLGWVQVLDARPVVLPSNAWQSAFGSDKRDDACGGQGRSLGCAYWRRKSGRRAGLGRDLKIQVWRKWNERQKKNKNKETIRKTVRSPKPNIKKKLKRNFSKSTATHFYILHPAW